jgi:aldose 1-epimerase
LAERTVARAPLLTGHRILAPAHPPAPKKGRILEYTEHKVNIQKFGKTPDGTPVELCTLTNSRGVETAIATYGGTVVTLKTPDRAGRLGDIVLGFDTLDGYLGSHPFFGALIGRYGNRIAKGRFSLNGVEYKLAVNNGENHLHGGLRGFDKVVWKVKNAGPQFLELGYLSKDGEEGYPGNLDVTVRYTLTDDNELGIDYSATTDKDTVVNLTNHSYFNFAGQGDVLGYLITLNADRFTPTDSGSIPTGELRSVAGTPFDFRQPVTIGSRIEQDDEQLRFGAGYDHNYVLNRTGDGLSLAARATDPVTGRVLEVFTMEPGVQFYCGSHMTPITGKGGTVYQRRWGFCLETQRYPDSPNKPAFPTTVLKPGQRYHTATVHKFSAE